METANLLTLIFTALLVLERCLKQTKKCKSKCCCVEIDTELQSPTNKKDYKDSREQQPLEQRVVELPQVLIQPVP